MNIHIHYTYLKRFRYTKFRSIYAKLTKFYVFNRFMHRFFCEIKFETNHKPKSPMVTSMLVTDVGDQMCRWKFTSPTSGAWCHQHVEKYNQYTCHQCRKMVTNIIVTQLRSKIGLLEIGGFWLFLYFSFSNISVSMSVRVSISRSYILGLGVVWS